MDARLLLSIVTSLIIPAAIHATPEEAQRIEKSWKLEMEKWALEARSATSAEQRAAVVDARPDLAKSARRMWLVLENSLTEPWTLPHMAWFLRASTGLLQVQPDGSNTPMFARETEAIRSAIERHHMRSPGLAPVCLALAATPEPRSLSVLETIESKHPERSVQGVAALGAAIILKSFGDEPELMRKRLTYLRKAIIESSDVDLGGGITVAKLAEDELYIIRFLGKGRIAPDLTGVDSGGRPLRISEHSEKAVVLMFWSSTMNEAERVLEITRGLERKFANRQVRILGVNQDPLEKLRSMEADGTVGWRSFSDPSGRLSREYRVAALPLVYVLDADRKIHYSGPPGSFVEFTVEALLAGGDAAGNTN